MKPSQFAHTPTLPQFTGRIRGVVQSGTHFKPEMPLGDRLFKKVPNPGAYFKQAKNKTPAPPIDIPTGRLYGDAKAQAKRNPERFLRELESDPHGTLSHGTTLSRRHG